MKTLSNFTLCSSNLNVILTSQRSVLNIEDIGYTGGINRLKSSKFLDISKHSLLLASTVVNLVMYQILTILKNMGFQGKV